jgi:hypothetical protein
MSYDHLNANGAIIEFLTTGFTAEIRSFNEPPESVEALDKTHLGSTHMTRRPGKVRNVGEMSITINYDPDDEAPIGIMEPIRITYPPPEGSTQGAKRDFRGFISNFEPGEAANDTVTEATITITVDGAITRGPSAL